MNKWCDPAKKSEVELKCDHGNCGFTTKNEISMNRHGLIHLYENRFECADCHHTFGDKEVYFLHRKTHEPKQEIQRERNPSSTSISFSNSHSNSTSISTSRSRSKSESSGRATSRFNSRSHSRSRLRSRSNFRSRSKERSRSRSRPILIPRRRSQSRLPFNSRSPTRSRSKSQSQSKFRSRAQLIPRSRSKSKPRLSWRSRSKSRSRSRARSNSSFKHRENRRERQRHYSQPQSQRQSHSHSQSHHYDSYSRSREHQIQSQRNYERGYFTSRRDNEEEENQEKSSYQRGYFTSEYLEKTKSPAKTQSQPENTTTSWRNSQGMLRRSLFSYQKPYGPGEKINENDYENEDRGNVSFTPPASPEPEPEQEPEPEREQEHKSLESPKSPKAPEIIPLKTTSGESKSDESYHPSSSSSLRPQSKLQSPNPSGNRTRDSYRHRSQRRSLSPHRQSDHHHHHHRRHESSERSQSRNPNRSHGRLWSALVRVNGNKSQNQNRWVVKNKAMVKSYADSPPVSNFKAKSKSRSRSNKKIKTFSIFRCQQCTYVCRSNSRFQDHQTKHSAAKNFSCEYCKANFKYEKNVKRHVQTAHGSPKID